MKKKLIIPLKEKCKCGKRVTSHHFLCDKCWGSRAKQDYHDKQRELLKPFAKKIKEREIKIRAKKDSKKEKPQCKGICRNGEKCSVSATLNGYCTTHYAILLQNANIEKKKRGTPRC